jgi:hypothetical protein
MSLTSVIFFLFLILNSFQSAFAVIVVNRYLNKTVINKSRLCFLIGHEKNKSPAQAGSPTDTLESLACKLRVIPAVQPERHQISDYPTEKVDIEIGYNQITLVCLDYKTQLKKKEVIIGVGNINTTCLPLSQVKTGFKKWSPVFKSSLNVTLVNEKKIIRDNNNNKFKR